MIPHRLRLRAISGQALNTTVPVFAAEVRVYLEAWVYSSNEWRVALGRQRIICLGKKMYIVSGRCSCPHTTTDKPVWLTSVSIGTRSWVSKIQFPILAGIACIATMQLVTVAPSRKRRQC